MEHISNAINMEMFSKRMIQTQDGESQQSSIKLLETDCPLCGNRGYTIVPRGDCLVAVICKCDAIRRSMTRIKKSGLSELVEEYTLDKYETDESWRKDAKEKAIAFLDDHTGKWFGCFGQVGSGKTHLCTAICVEFLKAGKPVIYMPWRDDIVPLKASVTDEEEYSKAINELKTVEVLYIDDLFKTEEGRRPTAGDINIAFELLNYRYNNRSLITLVSCERQIGDIMDIDEAVGTRIYQRCKEYCVSIKKDPKKNWRLK